MKQGSAKTTILYILGSFPCGLLFYPEGGSSTFVGKIDTSQTTRRRIPKYSYHNRSCENFKYYHIGLSRNPLQTREDSFTIKEKELLFVAREDKRRKIGLTLPLSS
jgi:hypothetical protein